MGLDVSFVNMDITIKTRNAFNAQMIMIPELIVHLNAKKWQSSQVITIHYQPIQRLQR